MVIELSTIDNQDPKVHPTTTRIRVVMEHHRRFLLTLAQMLISSSLNEMANTSSAVFHPNSNAPLQGQCIHFKDKSHQHLFR